MKVFKFLRYLIETIIIIFFFFIFKIIGLKKSSFISGKIFLVFGKFFRSQKKIENNLKIAFPNLTNIEIKEHISEMWNYYGKVFAEYIFLNDLRKNQKGNIQINGIDILSKLKENNERVIFVSGHFDNFELMAMYLENLELNFQQFIVHLTIFYEFNYGKTRKNIFVKNKLKKDELDYETLKLFNEGYSVALMIDQRVSEGSKIKFFNKEAYTTTIPGQFVKKFNCKVIPIDIVRINDIDFKIQIFEPFKFKENVSIDEITRELNKWLEKIIKKNPSKWIWSHNRWK